MRLILVVFACLFGTAALASETYDLIFKKGTLSELSTEDALVYEKTVSIQNNPEDSALNTGQVRLTLSEDDVAALKFEKDEKYRGLGRFPASVGNPIIMYFVETVVRDVAANAGGSPFYIRNRIKESLVQFAEIENAGANFGGEDLPVQQITLRPFLGDKNVEKMQGYGELAMTFTMSEDIPGWYYSLVASAKGPNGEVYNSALTLTSAAQQ